MLRPGGLIMNKLMRGGIAALAFIALVLPAAAQTVEFTLINDSASDLHYFYAAPSIDKSWGYDLLGDDGILEAGYQGTVTIGDGSSECLYDFKFVMQGGAETTAEHVNICELNSYTISD